MPQYTGFDGFACQISDCALAVDVLPSTTEASANKTQPARRSATKSINLIMESPALGKNNVSKRVQRNREGFSL
jgi:hypothetical protein